MSSRRLTKNQKGEILESYKAGENTIVLAEKYGCTANTINRTVKTLLSEIEYKLLKEKRSKIFSKKEISIDSKIVIEKKEDLEQVNSVTVLKEKITELDESIKENEEFYSQEISSIASFPSESNDDYCADLSSEHQNIINNEVDNNFEIIAPLVSGFDFDQEKQKSDFDILSYESLPESVYMIVDKKVELDSKPISDFPEWSFLPEDELKRNAILLFTNQRSAKRICSRNQRVIKIPNTTVFSLSKLYLISKGITRLILDDLIIALDI
tara:strand:- start:1018 stop:1821 length:804 start_codon:yes stop_codon:yes gene_type:complete